MVSVLADLIEALGVPVRQQDLDRVPGHGRHLIQIKDSGHAGTNRSPRASREDRNEAQATSRQPLTKVAISRDREWR